MLGSWSLSSRARRFIAGLQSILASIPGGRQARCVPAKTLWVTRDGTGPTPCPSNRSPSDQLQPQVRPTRRPSNRSSILLCEASPMCAAVHGQEARSRAAPVGDRATPARWRLRTGGGCEGNDGGPAESQRRAARWADELADRYLQLGRIGARGRLRIGGGWWSRRVRALAECATRRATVLLATWAGGIVEPVGVATA